VDQFVEFHLAARDMVTDLKRESKRNAKVDNTSLVSEQMLRIRCVKSGRNDAFRGILFDAYRDLSSSAAWTAMVVGNHALASVRDEIVEHILHACICIIPAE
jgi:hypothetical protein